MPEITLELLNDAANMEARSKRTEEVIDAATGNPEELLRFIFRYASWNGYFGSGVATLAGKIGRCRGLFLDTKHDFGFGFTGPDGPTFGALKDRSVLVASHVFDAARDEFNDRDTMWRDTHRCLAQATVIGTAQFLRPNFVPKRETSPFTDDSVSASRIGRILREPLWLQGLNDRVAQGYGSGTPDDGPSVFHAMGFHLGSELLADQEFSLIDEALRATQPDLVAHLENTTINIGGQDHNAYYWIRIHSGHGGGVEAEHFDAAMESVRLAFQYTSDRQRDAFRHQLMLGFKRFATDQDEFFEHVNDPDRNH